MLMFCRYIRITPGPNRELAVPHKFELAAFKRTADQLQVEANCCFKKSETQNQVFARICLAQISSPRI
jgi:hypothetical protein